jgi:hypothetical protein
MLVACGHEGGGRGVYGRTTIPASGLGHGTFIKVSRQKGPVAMSNLLHDTNKKLFRCRPRSLFATSLSLAVTSLFALVFFVLRKSQLEPTSRIPLDSELDLHPFASLNGPPTFSFRGERYSISNSINPMAVSYRKLAQRYKVYHILAIRRLE